MAKRRSESRKFRLEGTGPALRALSKAISNAVATHRKNSTEMVGQATLEGLSIQVRVRTSGRALRVLIDSRDDAAELLEGWAENSRCVKCSTPVALLFEDNYLESASDDGPVCANCMGEILDKDATI
jgi:hypothetical protein